MKIKRGLSAGRVQSVALKMLCDREDEINAFIPKEYWDMDAVLKHKNKEFTVSFYGDNKGKLEITGKEQLDGIVKETVSLLLRTLKREAEQEKHLYLLQQVHCSRKLQRRLTSQHRRQ